MTNKEIIDKGFTSIENLMQELDLVVDVLQKAETPVGYIRTFIEAQVNVIISKAEIRQFHRWEAGWNGEQGVKETLSAGRSYSAAVTEEGAER